MVREIVRQNDLARGSVDGKLDHWAVRLQEQKCISEAPGRTNFWLVSRIVGACSVSEREW